MLKLDSLLSCPGGMSRQDAAEAIGVSVRRLSQLVEALELAGGKLQMIKNARNLQVVRFAFHQSQKTRMLRSELPREEPPADEKPRERRPVAPPGKEPLRRRLMTQRKRTGE